MAINLPKIGVLGRGFVGEILIKWFQEKKYEVKSFDIKGNHDPLEEVLKQDIIFISFLTKDNDGSGVGEYAKVAPDGRIFIIKSTFVPGTCDALQHALPDHKFVYNPEFLTEMTAWEDFTKPQFQILGCPHQSLDIVHEIFKILPEAPVKRVVSPLDAEILKHARNSFYALKVAWFNQLYDVCKELGSDYETIREIMVQDPWVGDSHSHIFHKGYRGYGGKCLSKDPKALAKAAKFPLINHIEEYNANLQNNQKINS